MNGHLHHGDGGRGPAGPETVAGGAGPRAATRLTDGRSGWTWFQAAVVLALAAAVGNTNALVDLLLHPEIPYFDREHLIVGGVTAIVSAALALLWRRSLNQLTDATRVIEHLEGFLLICAKCRKVRRNGADVDQVESWQSLESYVVEHSETRLSHGICPACLAVLYPEFLAQPADDPPPGTSGG